MRMGAGPVFTPRQPRRSTLAGFGTAGQVLRKLPSDAGFTLVEVMATVACMLVLGAMAVPKLQGYVLQSRLEAAKPYLMEIAAKQRMYRIENGVYCCTSYALDETTLSKELGLSLSDSGDFCFVFICQSGTLCSKASGPGFIAPSSGSAPEFEVWAILRTAAAAVSGPNSVSCQAAAGKAAPTGWAYASTPTTRAGRVGQAVVLRYPPPPNGISASNGNYHPVRFDWRDGFSLSDAMQP